METRETYHEMDMIRVRFGIARERGRTLTVKPHYVNGRELPSWQSGPDLKTYRKQLEAKDLYLISFREGEYVFERCDDILDA